MDRRLSGLLLLLVAVLLAVIAPRLLDPGEGGTAVRAPLPLPPLVGSCLSGPGHEVVPCGEPHELEVTASWVAGDPARPRGTDVAPCWDAANKYVGGPAAAGFEVGGGVDLSAWRRDGLSIEAQILRAPAAERVGRFGWKACVIVPATGGSYRGSALNAGGAADHPGAFGACSTQIPVGLSSAVSDINCAQPHVIEFLGFTTGFRPNTEQPDLLSSFPKVASDEELRVQCAALASLRLGSSDPSYDGRLVVQTLIEKKDSTYLTNGANEVGGEIISQQTYPGVRTTALCIVRPAGDASLVDSVVGLGTGQPPLR